MDQRLHIPRIVTTIRPVVMAYENSYHLRTAICHPSSDNSCDTSA